jgi:acetyltransferase-like isoleucine patch superfamily enzyme
VFVGGRVEIGDDVVIHPHATILPGVKIGDGAVIGAGSVVIKDVPPGVTMMGNPAKVFQFK